MTCILHIGEKSGEIIKYHAQQCLSENNCLDFVGEMILFRQKKTQKNLAVFPG